MIDLKNIPALKKYKILLIGDSCIDQYYLGSCERLNPEAPVPILKILDNYKAPGMASNVKENLRALGGIIDFITNKEKIYKKRYIDKRSGQHLLRVDEEEKITPWNGKLVSYMDYSQYDAIVISDYNKGFLHYEHIESVIKKSKSPVFIDTKKTDLARFEGAFIKINFLEYNRLTSEPLDKSKLIVTNGEHGAMCDLRHYPAKKVEIVDVCGAGDTFLSALTIGCLNFENNIDKAIEFAIIASSLSVQHRGNYAPKLKEIINA